MQQPGLTVDIHQDQRLQAEIAKLIPGVEFKLLTTGDYTWVTDQGLSVGVESKTAANLVSSFTTGQLAEQTKRLIAEFDIPVLLITGTLTKDDNGKVLVEADSDNPAWLTILSHPLHNITRRVLHINLWYAAIHNFLLSAQLAGLFIDHTASKPARYIHEATRLVELAGLLDKPDHTGLCRKKLYNPFVTNPLEPQLAVLRGLPGVNDVLTERLLQHFGSVSKICLARPEELTQVVGIGKNKAQAIWNVLHADC